MCKPRGSQGGLGAQVEVNSSSVFIGDGELTSSWGVRGGGMATEVRKVWLSGLGGGPQFHVDRGGKHTLSTFVRKNNNNNTN